MKCDYSKARLHYHLLRQLADTAIEGSYGQGNTDPVRNVFQFITICF